MTDYRLVNNILLETMNAGNAESVVISIRDVFAKNGRRWGVKSPRVGVVRNGLIELDIVIPATDIAKAEDEGDSITEQAVREAGFELVDADEKVDAAETGRTILRLEGSELAPA